VGGSPEYNAAEMSKLLDGHKSAYRDAVILNTAAALVVADKAKSLLEGAAMAAKSIDSGSAKTKLSALASITSGI
jgi:anthranilate phosphoribosyltransferase